MYFRLDNNINNKLTTNNSAMSSGNKGKKRTLEVVPRSNRRNCTFSTFLQAKYPFLTDIGNNRVSCKFCNSSFSIANSGSKDIEDHVLTVKHKRSLASHSNSQLVTSFYKKIVFGTDEKKLAATEGCWTYHTIKHNQSFRSTDCTSKLIQELYEKKYSCARTKSEAIVTEVFAPYTIELLQQDLEKTNFITLCCDTSNHKEVKLMPLTIRYFLPERGVELKLIELDELPGETSDIVSDYILNCIKRFKLEEKVVGFCADNTNSNFGGRARQGTNNSFYKVKMKVNDKLVGIGCVAHIINNCVQTACDMLPLDVQSFIVKVYSHFYIYTVRVEKLKDFCSFVGTNYQKVLGYCNTRWLALLPALERVLKIYEALKSYFCSIDKCPLFIKTVFENPQSQLWLFFAHNIASLFHQTVLKVEGRHISFIEVAAIYEKLIEILVERKNNKFLPLHVKTLLNELTVNGDIEYSTFWNTIASFYDTCIKYLNEWKCNNFTEFSKFHWICLKTKPNFDEIQDCIEYVVNSSKKNLKIDENELFNEVLLLNSYLSNNKISQWQENSLTTNDRWVEIFKYFKENNHTFKNILTIVEYCLCLPGTNAEVERVFSHINKIWTEDKTQLKITTLKAIICTKLNFTFNCSEFYNSVLLKNDQLLKAIHSSQKYIFKNKTD